MKIIRVFPRRTKATPTDNMARIGYPPPPACRIDADAVEISVAFTWDKPLAEDMAESWSRQGYPVSIGGPAYGDGGGDFEPGRYLAEGYVITSRGCPNRCPRCLVPVREGSLRLLPIRDGWNVLDNNLLACPLHHIQDVCDMLKRQPQRPLFTGGLEAARLTPANAQMLLETRPQRLYFAYDHPGAYGPLIRAVRLIRDITGWAKGTVRSRVGCYVLMGYEGDTIAEAEQRIGNVIGLGPRVYPMFWRGESYTKRPREWAELIGGVMALGGCR